MENGRQRNADVPWYQFDPNDYLARNYARVRTEDHRVVELVRDFFGRQFAPGRPPSGLCGIASSLEQLVAFRVLQGMAGGGLQPSSQAILLDTFPREKQGTAMTMFGVAALTGPIVGPTLGGWLVVNYDWRWIFYINLPVGALALLASYVFLDDPDYLKRQGGKFDRLGYRAS